MSYQLLLPEHNEASRALLTNTYELARLIDDMEYADKSVASESIVDAYVAVVNGMYPLTEVCPVKDAEGRMRRWPIQWTIDKAGEILSRADRAYRAETGGFIPAYMITDKMTPPPGWVRDGHAARLAVRG